MFEVRLGECDRWWFIYEDGRLWSPCGYRSEWAALEDLANYEPEAARELEQILWSLC